MALDPQIALGFRPPQINLDVPSPIHQMGQMMTLRGLMEQQQLRRSQIEQEQYKLESLREANAGQQEFQRRALAGENLTQGQTLGYLGPKLGTEFLKGQSELEEQRFKQNAERMKQLGSIIGSAVDTPTFTRAVMEAHSQGYFNPEQARQFLQGGYDPARVKQYRDWAMTAEQQNTAEMNRLKADREAKESTARVAAEEAQERLRGLEIAAQTAPDSPQEWPAWRAQMAQAAPKVLDLIPPNHSTAAYQLVKQYGVKPRLGEPGKDFPYSPPVFQQKLEEAQALSGARLNTLQTQEKIEQDLEVKKRELELQNQTNINKAMSGDAAKVYSIASNLRPGLEQLRQAFKKDYGGTLRGIVLGTNPELAKLAANVADQVGRLRSGGAVNPSEEKRFMDQIASRSDLVVGRLDAALAALDRYTSEAKSVSDNLKPGGPSPTVTDKPATHKYNPATGRIEAI